MVYTLNTGPLLVITLHIFMPQSYWSNILIHYETLSRGSQRPGCPPRTAPLCPMSTTPPSATAPTRWIRSGARGPPTTTGALSRPQAPLLQGPCLKSTSGRRGNDNVPDEEPSHSCCSCLWGPAPAHQDSDNTARASNQEASS